MLNTTRQLWLSMMLVGGVAVAGKSPVIERADLRAAVRSTTIATIRRGDSELTNVAFRRKMKAALRSPMHLKQTFPGLLGTMLKDLVGTKKLPGKVAPIGFDAHIENAGTVRVGHKQSIQTLIDVDDSGLGPAGVDALSIGTALQQAGFDRKVMSHAFDAFARAAVDDDPGPREVKGPKWGALRRAWIAKNTRSHNGRVTFKGMKSASPNAIDAVRAAAAKSPVLKGYEILDVGSDGKDTGGSSGLDEYLLLARNTTTKKLRVYLLKEQQRPGAAELGIPQPSDRTRLRVLERALWKDVPEGVFFYLRDVELPGVAKVDLLVRDKLDIVGDVARGKDADKVAVEVARLYGREHAGQFASMTSDELAHWMKKSTHAVSASFDDLWKQLRDEKR